MLRANLLLRRLGRSSRSGAALRGSGGRSSPIGRSGGRIGSRCCRRRSGLRRGRSRRSCSVGAGGFLLRAGRQHQRRNKCAKSKFCFHRSVPRREARVVFEKQTNEFLSFRESFTGRAGKFYRVPAGFETVWQRHVAPVRQQAKEVCTCMHLRAITQASDPSQYGKAPGAYRVLQCFTPGVKRCPALE